MPSIDQKTFLQNSSFLLINYIHFCIYVSCNVNRMTQSHKNATFAPQLRHSMPHVDHE